MSPIICATEKIKVYEGLCALCEYAEMGASWGDALWQDMLGDPELYGEFVYYLEHHGFADHMKSEGYSLTDFYVWRMQCDNLSNDTGKNTAGCNKEKMVLQAFHTMAQMKKDPVRCLRKLDAAMGMDRE